MDWDNLRYFLEVARVGTLAAAARRMPLSSLANWARRAWSAAPPCVSTVSRGVSVSATDGLARARPSPLIARTAASLPAKRACWSRSRPSGFTNWRAGRCSSSGRPAPSAPRHPDFAGHPGRARACHLTDYESVWRHGFPGQFSVRNAIAGSRQLFVLQAGHYDLPGKRLTRTAGCTPR